MSSSCELFGAAEIAEALGVTPRAIRLLLADVPDDGSKPIRGQAAKAWKVMSLPPAIIAKLETMRVARRCRTVPDLLAARVERYCLTDPRTGAPITLAEIEQDDVEKARLLQRALARVLQHPEWRGAELEQEGVADYRRIIGHEVSAAHWSSLHQRAIDRDGGLGEWHRLELYLADRPKRIGVVTATARVLCLDTLELELSQVRRPASMSVKETAMVWLRACDQVQQLLDAGRDEKRAKRAVLVW